MGKHGTWTREGALLLAGIAAIGLVPADATARASRTMPALKRYLWCQVLPFSTDERGPRFQGGFGIYETPEPWGP